ncbi:MAG TPA: hypothetical protein VD794_02595 [Flavisolibacter sp.]|nr:hypothetical protein [Flavisolibacter sp.]
MQLHWLTILGFALAAFALLIFLINRNQKDKQDLVNKLNQDYKKPNEDEPFDSSPT